jgi:hypothetical protein
MRKSAILIITIAVCLMSASPSQAQRITHSTRIWAQSSAPAKAEKVKCSKYHAPLVRIPQFKLVKQTCEELYSGQSSMEFKAVKIYSGQYLERDQYRTSGLTHKPDKQVTALKKTLKNLLAKGWDMDSISDDIDPTLMNYDNLPMGWKAKLSYINRKTQVAVFADLRVSVNYKLNSTYTKGTSWVVISVSNLHQIAWE